MPCFLGAVSAGFDIHDVEEKERGGWANMWLEDGKFLPREVSLRASDGEEKGRGERIAGRRMVKLPRSASGRFLRASDDERGKGRAGVHRYVAGGWWNCRVLLPGYSFGVTAQRMVSFLLCTALLCLKNRDVSDPRLAVRCAYALYGLRMMERKRGRAGG